MRLRRWTILGVLVLAIGLLVPSGATAKATQLNGKVDSSLAGIVANGLADDIYGGTVTGDVPGTVYYLAKLSSVDASSLGALRLAGATVRFRYDLINWVALSSPADAVARVASVPQVRRLTADRVLHTLSTTVEAAITATTFEDQAKRPTRDIGADVAWQNGITGTGVTVGVVDSGIDSLHGDLSDHLDAFFDCNTAVPDLVGTANYQGGCVSAQGYDDNGHGTHVSGIATGTGAGNPQLPGVAPTARLVGAKGCNAGGVCLNSAVMAGILQVSLPTSAGGAGANVVNLSLGGSPVYAAGIFDTEQETDNDPEAQLIDLLAEKFNVVFSIAAGNAGPTLQSVGSPSTASQGISVGASVTDWDLDHPREETLHGLNGNVNPDAAAAGVSAISTFSSRGPSGDRQIKPDITAPGAYIVSTEDTFPGEVKAADAATGHNFSSDPSYAVLSGTSMAAPSAAGAAALVIDGYTQAIGSAPAYYITKAAMANTARGGAFEGPITGLTSSLKSNRLGMDPKELFPPRNDGAVGVTGNGAGRVYVPDAILAATAGVVAFTTDEHNADGIRTINALQPSLGLDDIAPGAGASQAFILRGGQLMTAANAAVSYTVESGPEALGVNAAPADWFSFTGGTSVPKAGDTAVGINVAVPANAAPGQYAATVVARADIGSGVTQNVRIPVQFFVPVPSDSEFAGAIWASDVTDYSIVGFENPLGQIYTDWTLVPYRVPQGVSSVSFSVWDEAGTSTMDLIAFKNGVEVGSTFGDAHMVPAGAALSPTSKDAPGTFDISVVGGDSADDVHPGDVLWLVVSDTSPTNPTTFETYRFSTKTTAGEPAAPPEETEPIVSI